MWCLSTLNLKGLLKRRTFKCLARNSMESQVNCRIPLSNYCKSRWKGTSSARNSLEGTKLVFSFWRTTTGAATHHRFILLRLPTPILVPVCQQHQPPPTADSSNHQPIFITFIFSIHRSAAVSPIACVYRTYVNSFPPQPKEKSQNIILLFFTPLISSLGSLSFILIMVDHSKSNKRKKHHDKDKYYKRTNTFCGWGWHHHI